MEDISYEEAQQNGVDVSMVSICKKVRALAKLDRITIDESTHRSGLNKHLFAYVNYCGLDMLAFVKQYLANLQPFMIQRKRSQESKETFVCLIDNLYRVNLYVKIDTKQFEEIVVSFHEDNKRGIAKTNSLQKANSMKYVPVFADCIGSKITNENRYVVKIFVQRGLMVLPIELPAIKCNDVFIVEYSMIERQFVSYCNDYVRELYTSDLDLDFDSIEVFSVLQQISFTSYGKDTFSSMSLLIDSITVQTDFISRSAADLALVTFVKSLKLTEEQCKELVYLLEQKFSVTSIKGIDLILDRIKVYLQPIGLNNLDVF
ncbi:hypothetical protein [Acetivibrio ethanolgignens]|nr:hypothetical protein [Acetivibrio ethanolgignens]